MHTTTASERIDRPTRRRHTEHSAEGVGCCDRQPTALWRDQSAVGGCHCSVVCTEVRSVWIREACGQWDSNESMTDFCPGTLRTLTYCKDSMKVYRGYWKTKRARWNITSAYRSASLYMSSNGRRLFCSSALCFNPRSVIPCYWDRSDSREETVQPRSH